MRLLAAVIGFCAFATAIFDFSRDGWHSGSAWEAVAVYCGCTAVAKIHGAMIAAADRRRAEAMRDYDVGVIRDGILAARQALEL